MSMIDIDKIHEHRKMIPNNFYYVPKCFLSFSWFVSECSDSENRQGWRDRQLCQSVRRGG